jgi:hypothetical protein
MEGVVEGAVGMVPVVGSPIASLLAVAMGWSLGKRTNAWLDELAETVEEMRKRLDGQPTVDELVNDDVFVDAVVNATRAAQGTHQKAKRDALRNGVYNSLGPDAPAVDEQVRFFRLIDEFSPAHLRLLRFLDDPSAVYESAGVEKPNLMMGGRSHLLEAVWPEFAGQRPWYDLLAADLERTHLVGASGLHVTMSGAGVWGSATSDLGKRFLTFITGSS